MIYPRAWPSWRPGEPAEHLSILQLVDSGTLDLRLASLLWLIMERRTSVIVAAGPRFAGKTTMLRALLDFLPPELQQVHLQGAYEDFKFLEQAGPANTYMVATEISDHLDVYVWGDVAREMFELLPQGYALGATMHARTAEEVLYILHRWLGVPVSILAHLGAIITLRVMPGGHYDTEPSRRVEAVSLAGPGKDGLSLAVLASRGPRGGALEFANKEVLEAALSVRLGLRPGSVAEEMEGRERLLGRLLAEGRHSSEEVRKAVLEFYR